MATSVVDTVKAAVTVAQDIMIKPISRKARAEGTIASVFASLAGEAPTTLPQRFADLKK
jgi:hypothetical protein